MNTFKKIFFNKNILWLIAISGFVALYGLLSLSLFTQDSFQQKLLAFNPNTLRSITALFLILTTLSCMGMPRQVVAFTCGYFFGVVLGVLYATIAVTIAAYLTYKLAALFQQSYLTKKYQKQLTTVSDFLSAQTFSKAIIIRILPVGSNFLTNLLAGVSNVPLTPYLAGSFIGFIPQMTIFALAGTGVKLASSTHIISAAILLLIATLLGFRLYKKNKAT